MDKKEYRPWRDFIAALAEHLGSPRRAQTNFCEHTTYSLSSLQHWRKTNKVPQAAFEALRAIDPEKCSTSHFQGYHSSKFTARVVELSIENKTLSEIASILSDESGRPFNENMIKGIRYRNKKKIANYRGMKETV